MRLALHTIICCCVIAAVLPVPVEDAAGDASLRKRIRAWLQNHRKTDLDGAARDRQVEEGKTSAPPSSSGLGVRHRRAASGCFLFLCVHHNLLSRMEHFNNNQKDKLAPKNKIDGRGYGRRRRRSLEDGAEAALQTDGRDSAEAPRVCGYSICMGA
uniref:Adrenomedullin n=1 Tax=Tetraodon nigroviridis TaxID=99883 RepID=H3BXW0_TETNG